MLYWFSGAHLIAGVMAYVFLTGVFKIMLWFLLILGLILVIFLWLKKSGTFDKPTYEQPKIETPISEKTPKAESKIKYSYVKINNLLTPAERSFLGVLHNVVNDDVLVFSKVRVADVLSPVPSQNRSLWQKAFNSISSKHFDFVLCKADDISIICAIELNDSSHNKLERHKRDQFLRSACDTAGVKLLEIPAKNGYVLSEISELLKPIIFNSLVNETPTLCQECGSHMVLRTAKRGKNIGNVFWACSAYPKCRYIENTSRSSS
ncbi:DUF2726 domain-containing protein [Photobacterium sp. J15]|uniref:DUF2726 domain-containing protein n=1 Tax=Photobacterium sp. J15 TaxID=265901 RepID=UPI001E2CA769|nr:DUF2726 domain-containing protein [Photobacterium sp. J15]